MISKLLKDKRTVVISLLFVLAGIRAAQAEGRFVLWLLVGVSFCTGLDFLINRLFHKKNILPMSAVITGFIVSGILDYGQSFSGLLFFCSLAIISKHLIRVGGKHIFNPANSGLFFATLLQWPMTWAIESSIYLIVVVGLYIIYSIKKFPHVVGFLFTFALPFAFIEGINPLLLVNWFFVFVMLVEPKTSGYGVLRGLFFGGIAGISSFLFYRFFPRMDLFVTGLFAVNAFNPVFAKLFSSGSRAKIS